jgi:hypothetical protein
VTFSAVHSPDVVFSTIFSASLSVMLNSSSDKYCLTKSVTSTCSFTDGKLSTHHSLGMSAEISLRFLAAASCHDVVMVYICDDCFPKIMMNSWKSKRREED